ncbi:MAG: apiosidase-like domain-containing protein [Bacteroidales bacterium]
MRIFSKKQSFSFRGFLLLVPLFFVLNQDVKAQTIQWACTELTFETTDPAGWRDFPLQVEFTKGDRKIVLDGFWDGGGTFKVRFVPTDPGTWTYKTISSSRGLNGKKGQIKCIEPNQAQIQNNINYRGFLKVSGNGHYFTYADGTPVLILADCQLLGANSLEIFKRLLEHRKSLGFNGLNMRLAKRKDDNEGGFPYLENDINMLNPEYFRWVDKRLELLWENGFISIFMPDFMGNSGYSYDEVRDITRYLFARYAAFNIMYIVTGEYDSRRNEPVWASLDNWFKVGESVRTINTMGYNIPVGIHPLKGSSSDEMHDQEWLTFNQIQSKLWEEFNTVPWSVLNDYSRVPAKPTFYAEGIYENQTWPPIPADPLNNSDNIRRPYTYGSPFFIRHQIWVPLTCGATIVDYGEARVKNGIKSEEELISVMNQKGIAQAALALKLFRSFEWWKMEPHRESVLVNGLVPPLQRLALNPYPYCLAEPGKRYIVYIMGNSEDDLVLTNLKAGLYNARWFDPRTGIFININNGKPISPDSSGSWKIPGREKDPLLDWVLLVERE